MFVLVGCDYHLFLGQPCLFGVWRTHRGAWVWSAGGSHLGVSWNQEVSASGNDMIAERLVDHGLC